MAAGRIKIYRRKTEIVDGRRVEREPELHYSASCEIRNLYGQELYKALEIRLENTIVFEVRYCRKIKELQQNLKQFFIEFEGLNYDVYATDFMRNERQFVQLKANRTA